MQCYYIILISSDAPLKGGFIDTCNDGDEDDADGDDEGRSAPLAIRKEGRPVCLEQSAHLRPNAGHQKSLAIASNGVLQEVRQLG